MLKSPFDKGVWPSIWIPHLKMLCAKFFWNWTSSSAEEWENVTAFSQTDGQATDNRWSEKFTQSFSSGELKRPAFLHSLMNKASLDGLGFWWSTDINWHFAYFLTETYTKWRWGENTNFIKEQQNSSISSRIVGFRL